MSTMRISQLAERSGVPASTLRFYEGAGLLAADRSPAGYRIYGEGAVERLGFIAAAKHIGLSLAEIGGLLTVWDTGACQDVKADLRPRVAARLTEAERRVAELMAFIGSLHNVLKHLDALPDRTEKCDPECGFAGPAGPRRWRTAPVACSLTADGRAERTADWHALLAGAHRTEIPNGLRLSLPATRAPAVATLAAAEQQCCPFFDFRLHLDGPTLHLEVRAPTPVADLLTTLFAC